MPRAAPILKRANSAAPTSIVCSRDAEYHAVAAAMMQANCTATTSGERSADAAHYSAEFLAATSRDIYNKSRKSNITFYRDKEADRKERQDIQRETAARLKTKRLAKMELGDTPVPRTWEHAK